jgi:uncharacterized protein (DUF3084 family)
LDLRSGTRSKELELETLTASESALVISTKKEAVAKKMQELQGASGAAWEKAKQELDKMMAELEKLYEDMKKDFSTT